MEVKLMMINYNGTDIAAFFCDNSKALYNSWQQPTFAWVPYNRVLYPGY
jgi:hypothetical protein